MANKKTYGFIGAGIVLVGLILVVVGLLTAVVSASAMGITVSIGLFDELWDLPGAPSTAFAVIAFIVALVGAVLLLVDAILRVFVGKDIRALRLAGVVLAAIGGILVLVAGLMLANKCGEGYSAGIGVWLGFIGGLVATVGGAFGLIPAFNKD